MNNEGCTGGELEAVKGIYKMIEKWKDTAYSNRDFEYGYATAMKDVKEYIESHHPQVIK